MDDIVKDDNDVTGQKEVMGGSVQVDNQFHMKILMRMQMINPNTNQTPRMIQKLLRNQNQNVKMVVILL